MRFFLTFLLLLSSALAAGAGVAEKIKPPSAGKPAPPAQPETPNPEPKTGPESPVPSADRAPPAAPGEEIALTFQRLDFRPASEAKLGEDPSLAFLPEAPEAIRKLDGRTVRLTGYMMPLRTEDGRVRECLIVPSLLNCCYGKVPRFCEFVIARMTADTIPNIKDLPVVFRGTLRVGDIYEHGYWSGFYRLDCTGIVK